LVVTDYWVFFSEALKDFGGSPVKGLCMLANALNPSDTTGRRMNRVTRRPVMIPGVRSW